jgi:uncharacterized protein YbjQ (UPF0145 family)
LGLIFTPYISTFMKRSILFCFACACLMMVSCGTIRPSYFGASYPATQTIDSYYAAKDVTHSYKVIGHFAVKSPEWKSYTERAKQDIIEEAKKQGADGVIFSAIDYEDKSSTTITIKADAIKYDK